MTIHEFRKKVKEHSPAAVVKVKTVSFQDLARGAAKFVTVTGISGTDHNNIVRAWAREAGPIPQF